MNVTALRSVSSLLGGDTFPKCESASLRLEKFVRIGNSLKKEEVDAVVGKAVQKVDVFEPKGAVSFVARLRSNLIVNQAGGVLENAGLCIHPHFNAPYIPGSAVKGCARHAAWCKWNEEDDEAKKLEIANLIAEVFGYPTGDSKPKRKEDVDPKRVYLDDYLAERGWKDKVLSGAVSFLPAFPAGSVSASLTTDIVNCHHMEYYGGNRPDATDDESPNPQFFPAVKAGSQFVFTLVPQNGRADCVEHAKCFLQMAMTENGMGAKTAAGYGWFECNEQYTKEWRESLERDRFRVAQERLWKSVQENMDAFEKNYPGRDAVPVECVTAFKEQLRKVEVAVEQLADDSRGMQMRQRINMQTNRLPQLSPFERMLQEWDGKAPEACVIHRFIEEFENDGVVSPALKKQIVDLFRSADGIGAVVWTFLKDDGKVAAKLKKKHVDKVRKGRDAIRRFAKTTPEGALK